MGTVECLPLAPSKHRAVCSPSHHPRQWLSCINSKRVSWHPPAKLCRTTLAILLESRILPQDTQANNLL